MKTKIFSFSNQDWLHDSRFGLVIHSLVIFAVFMNKNGFWLSIWFSLFLYFYQRSKIQQTFFHKVPKLRITHLKVCRPKTIRHCTFRPNPASRWSFTLHHLAKIKSWKTCHSQMALFALSYIFNCLGSCNPFRLVFLGIDLYEQYSLHPNHIGNFRVTRRCRFTK